MYRVYTIKYDCIFYYLIDGAKFGGKNMGAHSPRCEEGGSEPGHTLKMVGAKRASDLGPEHRNKREFSVDSYD